MAVDLVVLSAQWCAPCKAAERAGVYQAVSDAGFSVIKIDVDTQKELAAPYKVSAVPTYILRRDEKPVGRITGVRDARTLIAELKLAEDN